MPLLRLVYFSLNRAAAKIQIPEQKGHKTMGLLNDICEAENIKLIGFTEELAEKLTSYKFHEGIGRAIAQDDKKYILYDKTAPQWEKRFIVAHEVGHHLLGHLKNTELSYEGKEMEANIFASVLVALLIFKEYERV